MRNASEESCRRGFEFFVSRNGITTHTVLNDFLFELCYDAVSPRMYRHYERMFADGVTEYCPLNRYEYVESV